MNDEITLRMSFLNYLDRWCCCRRIHNRSYHFGSRQRAMASRGFNDLWAKASLQYATSVVAGPGKVVACGWLFPVSFFVLTLVTFGPPYIGTDFSAYLKTDGNVADKNDAFEAALVQK